MVVEEVGDLSGKAINGEGHRRRPCGKSLGDLGRPTQVARETQNHRRAFDQRDQLEAPPTPRTGEHIHAEAAEHQPRCVSVACQTWPIPPSPRRAVTS